MLSYCTDVRCERFQNEEEEEEVRGRVVGRPCAAAGVRCSSLGRQGRPRGTRRAASAAAAAVVTQRRSSIRVFSSLCRASS